MHTSVETIGTVIQFDTKRGAADCMLVAHFVRGIYDVMLPEILLPGCTMARKVAVSICDQLHIPQNVICDVYATRPAQILLWNLELSARYGCDSRERIAFEQMLQSCRSITRKWIPTGGDPLEAA